MIGHRRDTGRVGASLRRPRRLMGILPLAAIVVATLSGAAHARPSDGQDHPSDAKPSPTEPPKRDPSAFRLAVLATVGGNLLDGVTTVAGLSGGRSKEVNPLLGQNPARILILKGLFTVPQILAEKRLVDHGHPRAARWLGYTAGGFATVLAIHNLLSPR